MARRTTPLDPGAFRWQEYAVGTGSVERGDVILRLAVDDAAAGQYSDAQIDDYQGLARRQFRWRPPLRMTVKARFSHPAGVLRGTAGFGFWNDPYSADWARLPKLPRAVWFFYASSPSNMKLDRDVPGCGWKAATIDALAPAAFVLAPVALPAVLLMNVRSLYRRMWPPVQRALHIGEVAIGADMVSWHTYCLEWHTARTNFSVDGVTTLEGPSPLGPLGFVAWLDNQYMVATPWGQFRWGRLEIPGRQWLEIEHLAIEPL
jgi:hypothetical protein